MKGAARQRQVAVDASFDDAACAAGIALATPGGGGHAFALGVVLAEDSELAEAAAVLRGLKWLELHRGAPGSIVYTDCLNVIEVLQGVTKHQRLVGTDLMEEIGQRVTAGGYVIAWRNREETKAAHWAALLTLRTWLAGRRGVPTPETPRRVPVRLIPVM